MMEGASSDIENGGSFSDEDGEHNVENFVLWSFAYCVCSPLLQGFLHEEELREVCDVSLVGCVISLSRLSGSLFLELSLWHSVASLC